MLYLDSRSCTQEFVSISSSEGERHHNVCVCGGGGVNVGHATYCFPPSVSSLSRLVHVLYTRILPENP